MTYIGFEPATLRFSKSIVTYFFCPSYEAISLLSVLSFSVFSILQINFCVRNLFIESSFVDTHLCKISANLCDCSIFVAFYNLRRYSSLRINSRIFVWSHHSFYFKNFCQYNHFQSAHTLSCGFNLPVASSLLSVIVIINLPTPSRVAANFSPL